MLTTPPRPVPAKQLRPPRRRTGQKVLLVLGILVVLGLVGAAAVAGYGWFRWNQVEKQDLALAESGLSGPQNFLIVGSDTREVVDAGDPNADAFLRSPDAGDGSQRADTIMIARVDASARTVDLLSFPRDLWVPIEPSGEPQRINTAYSLGGAQNLIDTIKADFGIDIHHYVEIDFASFKGVVSAVGGVPVYVDTPMRDENTGLYQYELGCVNLDGEQALAYARARHLEYQDEDGDWTTDPTGDIGRVTRQQEFMRTVLDRSQQQFGDMDVRAINDIVASTADNLKIDSGLQLGEIVDLARAFQGFGGDQMVTHTLPAIPFTTNGGAAVLRLDTANAEETFNVFRGLPPGTVSPSSVTLAVRNGSGAEMQATKVTQELDRLGYDATVAADADRTGSRTVVRYAPGYERHADQVARQLAAGAELQLDRSLEGEDQPVVLVTGTDFTTVLPEARPPDPAALEAATASSSSTGPSTTLDPEEFTGDEGKTLSEAPPGTTCS